MRVLSRLPERSMLGFSKLVANEVTQPLWPSSVPRITNCSAILGRWRKRRRSEKVLTRWFRFQTLVELVVVITEYRFKMKVVVREESPPGHLWAEA